MLKASLSFYRSVTLPNCKQAWAIKTEDTMEVDDVVFVKLNRRNSSLSSLLGNVGGHMCLKRSSGYEAMQQLRNSASEQACDAEECTLFDVPKVFKKRTSRGLMDTARQHPQHVEIPVKLAGHEDDPIMVRVLKAVHPNDCLWIEFTPEAISAILQYVVEGGFSDCNKRSRTGQAEKLPNGVHRRGSGFRVRHMQDGIVKYKCVDNLQDALAFHADPEAFLIAEADADSGHDQSDEQEDSSHGQAEEAAEPE